jgi:hypothetical protein
LIQRGIVQTATPRVAPISTPSDKHSNKQGNVYVLVKKSRAMSENEGRSEAKIIAIMQQKCMMCNRKELPS